MDWSPEQQQALLAVEAWLDTDEQVFRLFGYAGTGKTTLAKEFAKLADGTVLYGAYTGKAAHVLRKKGCPARTIHSLIYLPRSKATARLEELEKLLQGTVGGDDQRELRILVREEQESLKRPAFTLNFESEVRDASLVIIDEVSMVGERMGEDLLSFGTQVLVLGDPAQLPPVMSGGFFTDQEPNVLLTQVHRHGGPVLDLATTIRQGGALSLGQYGESCVKPRGSLTPDEALQFNVILTGKNATAATCNRKVRERLGRTNHLPESGDKLLCIKNNHDLGLLNGSQWTVHECSIFDEDRIRLAVSEDGENVLDTVAWRHPFEGRKDELSHWQVRQNDHFIFGYAMTCHKAQGSQWDRVLVIDESRVFRGQWRRWLYTAITRAAESITILT